MKRLTDIRAKRMEQAGKVLAPVLAEIFVEHGLDITTKLLMYYAAKGIIFNSKLSVSQREDKLMDALYDFDKAVKVLNKSLTARNKKDTL